MNKKCVICKTGDLHTQTVSVTLERQGALLVVRDVPACVCDSCRERYFEDDVAQQLLETTQQTLQPGVSLDIRHYQKVA